MNKKLLFNSCLILSLVGILSGLVAALVYLDNLPERVSQHETIVLGQNHLVPGSQAAMRVVVRDSKDAASIEGAEISVSLHPTNEGKPKNLFKGVTDQQGSTDVIFMVPDDIEPEQILVVHTASPLGSDSIERSVRVERDSKVFLSTDKPIYQPGQVIHVRTMALSKFDRIPAVDQDLELTIADGKGNKVFREVLKTSEWGIASVDFQLASEVNTGAYKISAVLGNSSSEKTVTVEHYVLPKFDVAIGTERNFYLPGEHVSGELQADYFFGKAVAGGDVKIEGFTFDVEKIMAVSLTGTTDENGWFEFEFDLPGYIAGSELDSGMGRFYLQATVIDLAKHTEMKNITLPISRDRLVIEAIPEGGTFKPGVENVLYILTSYPDGTPAETALNLSLYNDGKNVTLETGKFGLAEFIFTPNEPWQGFNIQARDKLGNSAGREFYFEGQWYEETVLIRTEKPVYQVGDSMDLTLLTSATSGTVYLDIVREGQTVHTQAVDITNGRTPVVVDLTPDLYGTLELHAYKILQSGNITSDTRLVVVDNADDLTLSIMPGQEVYLPGESAVVDLNVHDQDGTGVQSVVGLAVVDESVFALSEQDPGFAKLYFMLEEELLRPKYDLHGYNLTDLVAGVPVSSQEFTNAIENTAQASLSEAVTQRTAFSLEANSHQDAMQNAYARQGNYYKILSMGLFGGYLLISLVTIVLSVVSVNRQQQLIRSLLSTFIALVLVVILVLAWPHPWAQNPSDKLEIFFDWLSWRGEYLIGLLAFLALLGWIVLLVVAGRKKDSLLGWMLGLIPVVMGVLLMMVFSASEANLHPDDLIMVFGLAAFLMIPFAFLLRLISFTWSKQILPAVASLPIVAFLLLGFVPLIGMGGLGMIKTGRGEGVFMVEPMMEMAVMEEGMVFGDGLAGEVMDNAAMEKESDSPTEISPGSTTNEPPHLRQYFPETMLWLPEALTTENGTLELVFPVADTITTWRMTALASSQDGRLGSTTAPLSVFQDFFVDLDLPLALTVGDEVSVPVGVFNYLDVPQTVRLVLDSADWFEMLDKPEVQIDIGANDISVVYFRIKAKNFGQGPFKVTAWGSHMSDAIQKEVRVYPDGKQIHFTKSDRLDSQNTVLEAIPIPEDILPGTQKLNVKIYPGILSQVVEGLENILRMPYGCFEQTSSTTYPNVLVLDYLKFTDQAAPEVQFKAEEYINLGYQRLTTFEVGGSGGFSLFGDPPPDRMLTAYGLQEFSDMSWVHNIDSALVQRAADWLFSQQSSGGSWENDRGLVHENTWSNLGDDRLPVTAYIVWSLADAGYGSDTRTQAGLAYIKENSGKAVDPYSLAMIANAMVAVDIDNGSDITPATISILDRLASMAIQEGGGASWQSEVATFMGSEGQTSSIETTALVAFSFLRANRYPELANEALTALIRQKDNFGTWYSTQATVLSLKALIQSVKMGTENVDATVTVTLNDGQTHTLNITPNNFDVVQLVTFDDINIGRENEVSVVVEGEGNLMYQISGSYYLPWEKISDYPQLTGGGDLVEIELNYDREEIAVNDTVGVNVLVTLKEGQAESALIDLGLPPGFSVETEDLAALVARFDDVPEDYIFPTIERFELTGRQILIYVSNLTADTPLEFSYRLRAKFPLEVQTPGSSAYDYYNPDVNGEAFPMTLVVNE